MKRVILLIVVVAVGAVAWGYWTGWVESGIQQPIVFPHKKHAGDLALPCTTCHQRAENDAVAGRPPTALCLGCHMGGDSKSQEIKKLRAYGEKGQEIPWKRVWRLPSHVFFPHRIHVTVAKVKCQTCHGPMETLTRPPPRALRELSMNDCIDCHAKWKSARDNQEKAGQPTRVARRAIATDCNTCHR